MSLKNETRGRAAESTRQDRLEETGKKIPSKTKKCSEIFEFFVGTEDSRLEEKFSDNYSDTQETLLKV